MDLPYVDDKPQGAPDFYSGINATFRFILARFGFAGFVRYLEELAREYFAPVNQAWRHGRLPAVAAYWRAFFAAEPGAEVAIIEKPDRIEISVKTCPAIRHLRAAGTKIVPEFCRHCYVLGNARAEASGLAMRLEGGNGSCLHTYYAAADQAPAQDWSRISTASSTADTDTSTAGGIRH